MSVTFKVLVVLLLASVLSGCATYTYQDLKPDRYMATPLNSPDGGSRFCLYYMPKSVIASPYEPLIYLDDKYVGMLGVGKYVEFSVAPGSHSLRMECPGFICGAKIKSTIFIEGDRIYYYQFGLDMSAYTGGPRLYQITEKVAGNLNKTFVKDDSLK
ncbi:MAG: hypothetical protein U1F46_05900 [Marinagarivorans sp.]